MAGRNDVASQPIGKDELDRRVLAGQLDGGACVKRQDWPDFKSAAELYQGLAVPWSRDRSPDVQSPWAATVLVAPPWSEPPEAPPVAAPTVRHRVSGWLLGKLATLLAGAFCGFLAFALALGGPALAPIYSRQILFWLFAAYWLGMLLLAAGIFGGQPQALMLLSGPDPPPRAPLSRLARHALAASGLTIMAAVVWAVW